jgi:hypothetical protein
MRPGARYRSQVCTTEVIVVRAAEVVVSCGGHPMVDAGSAATERLELDPELAAGTQLGKRYTDPDGALEILVTRPGAGTLSIGREPLTVRAAKALPSSD